ncbi:hypothetical protein LPJ61_002120 [Coemansia biformis]|uniref:GH18 domain-containing protein n=1 Tax=Coemansia biformis TaxID=1286918 RepID=A0A9W8CXH6_9FUNG|nr:hypothetical protein LPJ61_002120 [Coemansia biformis]
MHTALIALLLAWLGLALADTDAGPDQPAVTLKDVPASAISSGVLNKTVVFGYTYETGVGVNQIAWNTLTHLVIAFFDTDSAGNIVTKSDSIPTLVAAARKTGVRVLASVGGDGGGSQSLAMALSTAKSRTNLAASLAGVVKSYGLDGVDYDFEFPGNMDQLGYLHDGLSMMRATLDATFGKGARLLTTTLYSTNGLFGPQLQAVDAKPFSDLVDYGLLMSYDYFGGFSKVSGPNAPFNDIPGFKGLSFTSSIASWVSAGWSPAKLVAGLPYYGRSTLVSVSQTPKDQFMPSSGNGAPGPVSNIPGAWTWYDLRDPKRGALASPTVARSGWQRFWDSTTMTPWLLNNVTQTYIGYDDPLSLTTKTNYVLTSGLAGAMVWMAQYDYNGELGAVLNSFRTTASNLAQEALDEEESSSAESESSDESSSESSGSGDASGSSHASHGASESSLHGVDSDSSGNNILPAPLSGLLLPALAAAVLAALG